MNKLIIAVLTLIMLAGCSTTNKYDAEIAKARYEYGKQVNERKPMFEIKGELRCSEAQIAASECGLVVYNQNQRYINVDPQSPDRFGQVLDFTGKLINPLFNWKIAQSNNDLSRSLAEQNTELFSTIFTGITDMKGAGTTYTNSNNDNSQSSSIMDSYNSSDRAYTDSYNTTSGDTLNDSYNTTSGDTMNSSNNQSSNETSTQGDTISNTPDEVTPIVLL